MNKIFYVFIGIVLVSCDPTYIADSADPRLPHFSTVGRNASGAYINDIPWRASCGPSFSCDDQGLTYDAENDYTELRFPEAPLILSADYNEDNGSAMQLIFRLRGDQRNLIRTASQDNTVSFSLDAETNTVELSLSADFPLENTRSTNGLGQLHFRYVEMMDSGRYIVAGTFGFVVDDETGYYKVRSGRFDFRFNF